MNLDTKLGNLAFVLLICLKGIKNYYETSVLYAVESVEPKGEVRVEGF
jgi:hypothetical protein